MKYWKHVLGGLAISATLAAFSPASSIEIGDAAPLADRELIGIDGKSHSLNHLKGEKGLLVVFSCNTCPFVLGWEDQYNTLNKIAKENGVQMVLLNSNEAKRQGDDSMDQMKEHASEQGYTMPYLVDANSELANAFGAQTTPHVYLFDKNLKLVFKGSINDKYENKDKVATKEWLQDALNKLGKGEKIDPAETRQMGCSIKRA